MESEIVFLYIFPHFDHDKKSLIDMRFILFIEYSNVLCFLTQKPINDVRHLAFKYDYF